MLSGLFLQLSSHVPVLGTEAVPRAFHTALVKHTDNFREIKWLGQPIWQNILDLWTIQETIAEVKPALLIETGTNRGGSSLFFAHLFDLLGGGQVITIDIERLHQLNHPRVTYLVGDSVSESVVSTVQQRVAESPGPIMVILDSDHSERHVARELEAYAPFVSLDSFILVQDGVMDVLPALSNGQPGPLPAVKKFLRDHSEYEVDKERCNRFLITHHPCGWLRRKSM